MLEGSDTGEDTDTAVLTRVAATAARQAAAENFPVALRIVPRRPRAHLQRIYTYARFVDDVGDRAPGDRRALLAAIDADLQRLPSGEARLAPVAGLAPVLADCDLPLAALHDLVEANVRDQEVTRYATFADLLGYCRLSAAPVGRLVLAVAGVHGAQEVAWSDSICAGLQVLEHCQDVREDAASGRVYLPADDLATAGVRESDLVAAVTSPGLRSVLARVGDRAARLLDDGRPLLRRLHGWPRWAVTGYLAGGQATVSALRRAGYEVMANAVRPSRGRTAMIAARLAVGDARQGRR